MSRDYLDENGDRLPGVTDVLRSVGWNAEGLLYWANKVGLEGTTITHARKESTTVGTIVHGMVEHDLTGEDVQMESVSADMGKSIENAYRAWRSWLSDVKFKVLHVEHKMVAPALGYGGTVDLIMDDGHTSILDIKTSKKISPEYLLQLAGYGYLYSAVEGRDAERYHVLRLDKSTGEYEHRTWSAAQMEKPQQAFLHALELSKIRLNVMKLLHKKVKCEP